MTTKNKEDLFKRIQNAAIEKGGQCLSTAYISAKDKMEFKCSNEAHPSWHTTSDQIITKGSWCTLCQKENIKNLNLNKFFKEAQDIAISKNGTLLSKEFISAKKPLLWQCSDSSHKPFLQNLDKIKSRGTWCKECSDYTKKWKEAKDIAYEYAKSQGGFVIFPKNIDKIKTNTMLTWKCSNADHSPWKADFRNTTSGSWCPRCAGKFTKEEFLQQAHDFAKKHNGTCLTTTYEDQNSIFTFKCSDNSHPLWRKKFQNSVISNLWCKECNIKTKFNSAEEQEYRASKLKEAKKLALVKNGICLSKEYIDSKGKLLWQCENGHQWLSKLSNIFHNKWCPECSGKLSPEQLFEKANNYAKLNKGTCLTKNIPLAKTKLEWKCADPTHKPWNLSYSAIIANKSWCPECGTSNYYKENTFKAIFEILLGYSFSKSYPQWNINPKTNKLLELDGYNEEHKIAFEFQGRHHIKSVFKNQNLEDIQYKDDLKIKNCAANNIKLIVIHDNKTFSDLNVCIETVKSELSKLNISFNHDLDLQSLHENIWQKSRTIEKEEKIKKAKEIAESKGGKCLSEYYFNNKSNLKWKCSNENHPEWEVPYQSVVNQGSWCKQCYLEGVQKK